MKRSLVAVLALALLAAACGDDASGDNGASGIEEIRPVSISGTGLPLLPEGGADPAVGMPIPGLEGASFDGTPVAITNDGRPKVLLFLTHW